MRTDNFVEDATVWEDMDGDTPLEKMLNAYLTTHFIIQFDVPSDECLSEARKVISIVRAYGESGQIGAAWDQLGRAEFGPKRRPAEKGGMK